MKLLKWKVFFRIKIDEPIKYIIVEAIDRWEASKKAYRKPFERSAVITDVEEVK